MALRIASSATRVSPGAGTGWLEFSPRSRQMTAAGSAPLLGPVRHWRLRMSREAPSTDPQRESARAQIAQRPLPLNASFAPSKGLVSYWIDSLSLALADAGRHEDSAKLGSEKIGPSLQHEFFKRLRGVLAAYAHQLRYLPNPDALITINHRFRFQIQTRICDAFSVSPDRSSEFLSLLSAELRSSVGRGEVIQGSWGTLQPYGPQGDLSFKLIPGKQDFDPDFIAATELE